MKIWTSEHIFSHNWETVTQSQWRKYPNPHNTAVLGTDVLERHVDQNRVLHTSRIITSDWNLSAWVQRLVGANRVAYGYEYSTVDPVTREMKLRTRNLTFCNWVSMDENMSYVPHPEDPEKTVLKQETVVTVQGVPLTSYMESIIVNTVSNNAGKGRKAIDWVVEKLGQETKTLSASLDKIKLEISDLTHSVEDRLISTAKNSIEELQRDLRKLHPPMLKAQEPNEKSWHELIHTQHKRYPLREEYLICCNGILKFIQF